ncbi:MAG TPA: type II toxin-antitoxin system HicA family toxin [Elusimicrobiota bacterium]|nr:type II toxin-antitoxin system HicA family toxin [Elusimicrobiota bacterium]
MKNGKLLGRIRRKRQNVRFDDFVRLVKAVGFKEDRQAGSHRMFHHECGAVLNLQQERGEAKPYQIKQFIEMVDSYGLNEEMGK